MMHTERHMFPGGNTSRGFFSYYQYILPQNIAEHIFILKGGPGVGKSTFMKKIAQKAAQSDFDVEFMHCSSDPNSLDGIVIPQKKIAILDGTSPHVVDPKYPGAIDEIINLGDYWNDEGIKNHKKQIMAESSEISRIFQRAYRYLAASALIHANLEEIYSMASDKGQVNKISTAIIEKIFDKDTIADTEGSYRKLFASAITPDGLKNYLPTLLNTNEKIILKGNPGTGTERILSAIADAALARGYYTEIYHCALLPDKPEHVIIPDKDISITVSNKYHTVPVGEYGCYNLDQFLNKKITENYEDYLQYNQLEFEGLLNRAIFTINSAKKLHDSLENCYIPYMNFDKVNQKMQNIIDYIMSH